MSSSKSYDDFPGKCGQESIATSVLSVWDRNSPLNQTIDATAELAMDKNLEDHLLKTFHEIDCHRNDCPRCIAICLLLTVKCRFECCSAITRKFERAAISEVGKIIINDCKWENTARLKNCLHFMELLE